MSGVPATGKDDRRQAGRVTRAPKRTRPVVETASSAADADAAEIVQVKVWLLGISPMVWRRVLVPSTCTLRELHGVIQVAMGWEHPPLSVLFACRALWLVGAVGILARGGAGGAAAAQGRPVCLRVRPEHSVAARGQDRGPSVCRARHGPPALHRGQRYVPSRGLRWAGWLHGRT